MYLIFSSCLEKRRRRSYHHCSDLLNRDWLAVPAILILPVNISASNWARRRSSSGHSGESESNEGSGECELHLGDWDGFWSTAGSCEVRMWSRRLEVWVWVSEERRHWPWRNGDRYILFDELSLGITCPRPLLFSCQAVFGKQLEVQLPRSKHSHCRFPIQQAHDRSHHW